jgi:hypothetical protein
MTEPIAACSWESIAAEPGRFSFTDALIRVLEEWINKPFTAAMLHEKPEVSEARRIERRRTPIYIVTTSNLKACSIQLSKIISDKQLSPNEDEKTALCEAHQPSSPPSDTREVNSLTKSMPNVRLAVPHILISLGLEEDQLLDAEACNEWLSAFPALAKYAKVQSVFKSHSTFRHDFKGNAFLTFYYIPLQDLLAITGDTWVFGRKITPASALHAAQIRLKMWSSSLAAATAATATQHACRILQDEITQRSPGSAFRPADYSAGSLEGCISDDWVLYIASLVCWAFGHRYQTSRRSIESRSSCISDPDSAIDVTSSSGYAEARAMEYLNKMLESSV